MTFKATIENKEDIKGALKVLSLVTDFADLKIDADGISIREMDPSHVALANLTMPKESFAEYECDKETTINIELKKLESIIKRAEKTNITLSLPNDSEVLNVTIKEGTSYNIRLREIKNAKTPLPKLDFTGKITLSGNELKTIIGDIAIISDYITLSADDKEKCFTGEGDDGDVKTQAEIAGDGSATYSLEFIKPLMEDIKSDVVCEFADNKPLSLQTDFGNGKLSFFMAPRVES